MSDEFTLAEARRNQREHEQRSTEQHRALDERITAVAAQSVTVAVWQQVERARDAEVRRLEHEHVAEAQRLEREHATDIQRVEREHARDVGEIREELKELRARPGMSLGRWLGVATVVLMFAGLMFQAYATAKGAK